MSGHGIAVERRLTGDILYAKHAVRLRREEDQQLRLKGRQVRFLQRGSQRHGVLFVPTVFESNAPVALETTSVT